MRWKKISNTIMALILSLAYTAVAVVNIIGPMHINSAGNINKFSMASVSYVIYWLISLIITWAIYISLYDKPKTLFFTLIVLGMAIIVVESFLWY